jgi:hypothetical protein
LADELFVLLEPWQLLTFPIWLLHVCLGPPLSWPQISSKYGDIPDIKKKYWQQDQQSGFYFGFID